MTGRNQKLQTLLVGMQNGTAAAEMVRHFLKCLNLESPRDPVIQLLGMLLKRTEDGCSHRARSRMFVAALFLTARDSKQLKRQLKRWMGKPNVVYPFRGMLFSHKKEWSTLLFYNPLPKGKSCYYDSSGAFSSHLEWNPNSSPEFTKHWVIWLLPASQTYSPICIHSPAHFFFFCT